MSSIIQQMKNNVAYKVHTLVSNPDAEAHAQKEAEAKKREAERAAAEKETAERIARQKARTKKESERLLKSEPGLNRIESLYTKVVDGDDVEYVEVSWKPWKDGRQDKPYVAKKTDFDAFVNAVDPELLKSLYATYEKEQKRAEDRAEKANFSAGRLAKTTWETFLNLFLTILKTLLGIFGASLATNLNLYKPWPYRLLYAIFGFLFWFIVIPYVLLYRWAWLKKQPKFYALIPLVPLRFENRFLAFFYSWLSYKPDAEIEAQKEWLALSPSHG